jgi:hypothetical protein
MHISLICIKYVSKHIFCLAANCASENKCASPFSNDVLAFTVGMDVVHVVAVDLDAVSFCNRTVLAFAPDTQVQVLGKQCQHNRPSLHTQVDEYKSGIGTLEFSAS